MTAPFPPSPRRHAQIPVLTAALLSLPSVILAQDAAGDATGNPDGDVTLNELVLTASGIATTIQDAPASITVINEEMIQEQGARDMNKVLRQVPGLNLSRGNNGIAQVSFRGLPANRTLYLVDGKRISSGKAFARHYQGDLSTIPVDAIERIEVVRGPMSTLYGSDAMGGVVNIITKKPTGKWSGSLNTDLAFGDKKTTGDSRQISGYASGALSDTVSLSLWGKTSRREAPDPFRFTDDTGTPRTVYGSDGLRVNTMGARLSWSPSDRMTWEIEGTRSLEKYLASEGAHSTNKLKKHGLSLSNEWQVGPGTLSSYLRYETTRNKSWQTIEWGDPVKYDTTTLETRYATEAQVAGRNLGLTFGGLLAHDTLKDTTTNRDRSLIKGNATTAALYAEGRLDVTDQLTLTGGLRLDHHEDFGEHLSPRVYANYDFGNGLMLKAGYARAFVAPDLRGLNRDYQLQSRGNGCKPYPGPCIIYGNPDLKPEKSDNFEIGLNYQGNAIAWEVTAFYNRVKDMIGARKTGATDPDTGYNIFERTNIDKGKTLGIEGGFSWHMLDELTMTNSFTYIHKSKFQYDFLERKFPMATTPRWNIATGLTWTPLEELSLSGTVTYVGKQVGYIEEGDLSSAEARAVPAGQNKDPYFLVDVSAAYDFSDRATLVVGIDNLFNEQPNRDASYREDGRLFRIGITTRF